ncbi:uncharacterized protein LOC127721632 [Mytilus californianus]|uniref:uncharacterized protein LOC127721632 n=1 Tax=Mytilus californianus TaxID=6549 RepID=UPI0022466AEB|nr:uncharacterized protein LOC127721632 [Mytilus californianus]
MPTECLIGGYRCGTAYPIYLSRKGVTTGEDIFPATGKIVNRTAYEVLDDRCVNEEYPIRIKNCTLYLVYYLQPTKGCDTAYCFGAELPCPDGQLSQTGYSPGCSKVYPSLRFTSTITVDMHYDIVINESRKYINETPKFLCRVNDATDDYTYDINFYINNVLITDAKYTNLSKTNIRTAVLLQKHWEGTFKPNMMVNCSVQARYKDRGVTGPKYFSEIYFAGIKVVDGENGIHVEENKPKSVEIKSTLPIGCSYQEGINVQKSKSGCYVGLYNGVPKYQSTANNEVVCSDETFVQTKLEFAQQNCRLKIPHVGWSSSYFINVTGVSDGIVNKVDRIVFLRLYTTIDRANKKDGLQIWNSIHLPDIKIYISDKDLTHINKSCYSSNDPYLRTFDQSLWNITSPNDYGEYVMYKHERLPQQVNVYFSRCIHGTGLCNCAVAVRSASSIFIANFCETGILSNRKINRYITARICDDQNLIVNKITDKTFEITFPSGTVVLMKGDDLGTTDSPFTIFSKIDITPSNLDLNLTTGLCGRYNNNSTDDFFTRENVDLKHNIRQFAKSWLIENSTETFFNPKRLPLLNYKVQEYCTCDAYETIQGQTSEPNFECRLSHRMKTCRKIETTTTIYHASCITSSHRQKRSLEEGDESPPMYDMMDDEQVEVDDQPAVWRNGLTEEIARQKCESSFHTLPVFEICEAYVPTVHSVNYIDQCISDMKIVGSDIFLYSNIRNFETMCLNDAKKFENLTDKKTNSPTGESKSILTVIFESTCPRNCSGKGYCTEGKCICNEGAYGEDCSLGINKQPRLIAKAFADNCDRSVKACRKFTVPGIDFIPANLTCKFRSFHVHENSSYSVETESFTNPGTYSSSFLMYCNLPESRKKRSVAEEYVASGYFISVSNNGNEFTEELTVIIFDARCYTCNSTTFECNEVDTCPAKTMYKTSDTSKYFGIGFGIAMAGLIVLVIVIVFEKKRFISRKYDVSNTSQQNPHPQYETVSSISISNYHEYSSILASPQNLMRESSSVGLENPQYENLP